MTQVHHGTGINGTKLALALWWGLIALIFQWFVSKPELIVLEGNSIVPSHHHHVKKGEGIRDIHSLLDFSHSNPCMISWSPASWFKTLSPHAKWDVALAATQRRTIP
jgi:hypothetical protein